MKMKKVRIISVALIVLLIAGAMPSCKKYEEGPLLSLRSKDSRLVNKWKFDKYIVNNTDYTPSILEGSYIEFSENGDFAMDVYPVEGASTEDTITVTGTWEFASGKTSLDINMKYTYEDFWSGNEVTVNQINEWDIIKLKKEEIIIETFTNNNKYEYYLVPFE
jgi:hypothetical protein